MEEEQNHLGALKREGCQKILVEVSTKRLTFPSSTLGEKKFEEQAVAELWLAQAS